MYARKQKIFALIAVHPAYAYEATTAKEPARSQVAELEPWKSRSLQVQRHRRGPTSQALPPLFLRAGQRSYVELLRGRRESLGTRLCQLTTRELGGCCLRKCLVIIPTLLVEFYPGS